MKRGDFIYTVLRVPLDFLILIGAGIGTYVIRTELLDAWRPVLFGPQLPLGRFTLMVVGASLLFVLAYAVSGLYAMKLRLTIPQEVGRIIVASSAAMMVVILIIFIRAEAFNSRFLVLGYWAFSMGAAIVWRLVARVLFRRLTTRFGVGVQRVALVGNDEVTRQISAAMRADPGLGYSIVCELPEPDLDAIVAAARRFGVDEVILATPEYSAEAIVRLVDYCHEQHVAFKFVPNIYQTLTSHYDVDSVGRFPLVQLRRTSLDGWGRVFKRLFDIVFSLCALIALAPLFAIIAFAIKWETYGPVFVRLTRISRNRQFMLFKFRSMIDNAHELNLYLRSLGNDRPDAGPLWKLKDDPRITRVGRFIRRTRLDELPQFINVLRGEMSVIGPRPHQPDEIARYEKHHKKLLAIKAGASGMAQVSGSSDLPFEEEVALDTFYIENWSLMLDIRIVVRTALKMLGDRSAV